MRSFFVVVSTPRLQLFASIFQRQESVSVQAFAAQLAVERLDECIVRGLTRAGEVQGHTALESPQIHVPRDKFTAIVHPDHLRIGVEAIRTPSARRAGGMNVAVLEPAAFVLPPKPHSSWASLANKDGLISTREMDKTAVRFS